MPLTVEEMMRQLQTVSEQGGVSFARTHLLFDAEDAHAKAILQYKGYLALSDAFKCLFLESVELLNTEIRPRIKERLSEYYAIYVPRISQSFRSVCGSERVAINGYPYQGYTLLRNVFDNLILTSAALLRVTDFYSIEGVVPDEQLDPGRVRKLRKDTEFTTRRYMTGDRSGLGEATISELAKWDSLFDYETHGARLSFTHAIDFMKGQGPLPVVPMFDEQTFALFMNRYSEVTWMLHRLMPMLQPAEAQFSTAWADKWQVLDESFELMVISLTEKLGKPIGAAIVELVQSKFPFTSKSVFPL